MGPHAARRETFRLGSGRTAERSRASRSPWWRVAVGSSISGLRTSSPLAQELEVAGFSLAPETTCDDRRARSFSRRYVAIAALGSEKTVAGSRWSFAELVAPPVGDANRDAEPTRKPPAPV